MTDFDNPLLIDRIKLTETKQGKPVIDLYHGPLQFPALQIFQFNQLFNVGIDPNTLIKGESIVTNFNAHWTESEKVNGKGNNYKDVSHLEPLTPIHTAVNGPALAEIKNDLAELKQLVTYLIKLVETTTAAAPQPQPAAAPQQQAPQPDPVTSLADELFTPAFLDGGEVPERHRAEFSTWQKANGRTPTATEFYTDINQAKSRIKSRPQ